MYSCREMKEFHKKLWENTEEIILEKLKCSEETVGRFRKNSENLDECKRLVTERRYGVRVYPEF